MSKNLFEVNGITYTDNIPSNMFIGVTKEQFCEYEQLKEENKQLKEDIKELFKENENKEKVITKFEKDLLQRNNTKILTELEKWLKEQINQTLVPEGIVEVSYKIQKLKEKYK